MARAATKTKAAQEAEVEDDDLDLDEETEDEGVEEVEDDDLILDEEDDEDDEVEDVVKPTRKKATATKGKAEAKKKVRKMPEITFGVRDLCEYLTAHNDKGKEYKPKDVRALIRRMAREDDPRVDREIVAGNKTRYDWPDGLKDPEVKRIIKAVTSGEIETARMEALNKLKERKAEKEAAAPKKAAAKKTTKSAGRSRSVDLDDDEDVDFEEEEMD